MTEDKRRRHNQAACRDFTVSMRRCRGAVVHSMCSAQGSIVIEHNTDQNRLFSLPLQQRIMHGFS